MTSIKFYRTLIENYCLKTVIKIVGEEQHHVVITNLYKDRISNQSVQGLRLALKEEDLCKLISFVAWRIWNEPNTEPLPLAYKDAEVIWDVLDNRLFGQIPFDRNLERGYEFGRRVNINFYKELQAQGLDGYRLFVNDFLYRKLKADVNNNNRSNDEIRSDILKDITRRSKKPVKWTALPYAVRNYLRQKVVRTGPSLRLSVSVAKYLSCKFGIDGLKYYQRQMEVVYNETQSPWEV